MDIVIIIGLLIAGVIFLLAEVFLLPGLSLAGFIAAGCMIYATIHAFLYLGTLAGWLTLLVTILISIAIIIWFMRSKTLDRLSLKKNITSSVKNDDTETIQIGDLGVATTRLALIGNAEFKGNIIEVRSAGEFIDEKTPIIVERITNGVIIVRKAN